MDLLPIKKKKHYDPVILVNIFWLFDTFWHMVQMWFLPYIYIHEQQKRTYGEFKNGSWKQLNAEHWDL